MINYKRAETIAELGQILRLQQQNLPDNLSSETKRKEGFVTVKHDLDLLTEMNNTCPHFIAVNENNVVGYSLCMHPVFGDEIEVLRPMFSEIRKYYPYNDFIVMGQICIDKDFRKQGIFRRLYDEMIHGLEPEYSRIITEVDVLNTRSLDAHFAVGFELICKYRSDGHDWVLIKLEGK